MSIAPDDFFSFFIRTIEILFRRYPKTASIIVFVYVTVGAYALVDTFRRGNVVGRFLQNTHYSPITLGIAVIAGMATVVPLLLRYLRTDTEKRDNAFKFQFENSYIPKLRAQIKEIQTKLAHLSVQGGTEDSTKSLSQLRDEISQAVYESVRGELGKELDQDKSMRTCQQLFKGDQVRLADQLSTLRRRGNLNLVIGVTTTLGAILVLILTVYSVRNVQPHSPELIAYFVPRISTVIFVEVFSFFFLRLYKATLEEEKYYQSQITSRSSLQIAFETAVTLDKVSSLPKVMDALAAVDKTAINAPEISSGKYDLKELGQLVEAASKVIATVAKAKSISE